MDITAGFFKDLFIAIEGNDDDNILERVQPKITEDMNAHPYSKVSCPCSIKQFCLISLCNVVYKIFS